MAMRLRDVARFVAGGIVGALAIGSLAGCSTTDLSAFRVVTTTTQVSDFTQHVLGESGLAYPLLQANQSAHTFDPSARDLLELRGADALVVNGQGLEPWAADAIAAAGFVGTIIVASDPVDPETRDGVIDPHVWTDPANAATYSAIVPCTKTRYTLGGAPSGSIVHLRVAAVDATLPSGMGPWSAWASGTAR